MFFAERGEQELIQQGIKRFSVRNQATPPGDDNKGNTAELANKKPASAQGPKRVSIRTSLENQAAVQLTSSGTNRLQAKRKMQTSL